MAPFDRPLPFHVQSSIDKVHTFGHHDSISSLWTTKWRYPCSIGIYPFTDGKLEDFEPIFQELIQKHNDNAAILEDPELYAAPFMAVGARLSEEAEAAEKSGDTAKACELFLRSAAVYRIARFPINRSETSQSAWELGRTAYLRGGQYLNPPNREVAIPFAHAAAVDVASQPIYANLRIPTGEKPPRGWPVLLFICGLDAYRSDHTSRTDLHVANGFATLSVDIPGTADSPAQPNDPTSADRLFSSVLDWIAAQKGEHGLDDSRVVARGISTGGYNALRIAHTHADRLYAAVCHGGGCHYMFDEEWIRAQNHMEYPFALSNALAYKFGYRNSKAADVATRDRENVEAYIKDAKKTFSLEDNGKWLDGKCCRLFIVNGVEDSIFPIEDSLLVASRGRAKELRMQEGKAHMGNPGGEEIVLEWINDVMKQS
jgi:pimeloyl-ACP methyl ester carboxylesterase